MLRRFREEHGGREREIGPKLPDQFGVRREDQFLVNLIRIPGVDDLHSEFTANYEFFRRIHIAAGIGLVYKVAVLLIGNSLNDLAARHNRLNQLAVAIYSKFKELAFEFHLGLSCFSKSEHRRNDP